MSIRGILGGLIGMAVFGAALLLALVVYANTLLIERTDQVMAQLRQAGASRATYGSAEVDLLSRTVVISKIDVHTGDKDVVQIDRINVDSYDYLNARRPRYADIRLTGVSVRAGDGSPLSALFRQVGLTGLSGKFRLHFDADPEKRTLDVRRFSLDIGELGVLNLEGRLGDWDRTVPTALLRALTGGGLAAFKGTKLELGRAQLNYIDRGLVNRYLKFVAAREDTSLTRIKRDIRRDLRDVRRQLKGRKFQPIRELIDVFARFVARPKALEVTIEPGNPVKVADLADMSLPALKTRLQLSVTAK